MSEVIKRSSVGDYNISTVRTDAGGAPENSMYGSPFSSSDYTNDTPWPYETMVFKKGSSKGLYHEPYSKRTQALEGHQRISEALEKGTLAFGTGVRGPFGVPSMTPQEWEEKNKKS